MSISAPYEFLVTKDQNQFTDISEDKRMVSRTTAYPNTLSRIVYFNRYLDYQDKLILQVKQVGKHGHHSGTGSFIFGVTTCDPDRIRGNQCHATTPCVPSNSCTGSSLMYKVTACSTIGFFAYFHRTRDGFVSVTIGKKTFPFTDRDGLFSNRHAYPFVMLTGAVDALSIIREDQLPKLAPIGSRTPRKRNSDSLSSSSSVTGSITGATAAASTPKPPIPIQRLGSNQQPVDIKQHPAASTSTPKRPIPIQVPPSSPISRTTPSKATQLDQHPSPMMIHNSHSNNRCPTPPVSLTPASSGNASHYNNSSSKSTAGQPVVKRKPVFPVPVSSVLDQQEFVIPKLGRIPSPLPGEINNRSHASTQTYFTPVPGNGIPSQAAGDTKVVPTNNGLPCSNCLRQAGGPKSQAPASKDSSKQQLTDNKSIRNGSIPIPDPVITSTSERRWYSNQFVRNIDSVISPTDLTLKTNYVFGNKFLPGQVIAFRIREINPKASGSIAFGFTTKSKHVIANLPPHAIDLPTQYPRCWYVLPDLLATCFSVEDVITIRRVSRSIVLRFGKGPAKNIFTIESDTKLYPFFCFNGVISGIRVVGGAPPDEDVPDAGIVTKDTHEASNEDTDPKGDKKGTPKCKSSISTTKVISSISFLLILTAAVFKYMNRK